MSVERETTMQLHGSADSVVELFDNWEGLDLISVRFGAHDGEGSIAWTGEPNPIDASMAKALAAALLELADRKDAA